MTETSNTETTTLRKVVNRILGGGTPSRAIDAFWNGEIPWASVKDFSDNKSVIHDTQEHITEKGLFNSAANLIEPKTVLVCTRMAIGRAAISTRHIAINQDVKAIYPNDRLAPEYLLLLIKQHRPYLESIAIGSTVKGLGIDQLLDLQIALPSRAEQSQIAAILGCIDRAIERTETVIAKQQRIKTGLMQDLLIKGIDERGNIRSEATHEFKDSQLGRIPKESVIYELGDVCEKTMVGLALSVTPYYREAGVPIIRNLNIKRGYFDAEDILYIDPVFSLRNKSKAVRTDDVITVRTGVNLGLTCLVPNDFDGAQTFTTLITTPNREFLLPSYLVFHMNSDKGIAEIEQLKAGGGKSNLNVGELIRYRIALPPILEQQRVINVLNNASCAIRRHEPLLKKLRSIKQGLMQDLLTGKASVENVLSDTLRSTHED